MATKHYNWYQASLMEREAASVARKLGFGVMSALVMLMLGSSLWNAAQHAQVTPEKVQEALKDPTQVAQARQEAQAFQQEEVQQEQAPVAYPTEPTDQFVQNIMRLEGTMEYQEHVGHYRNNRFYPYNDTRNVPTVGYGHRILPGENFQNGINNEQATQMLQQDAQNPVNSANQVLIGYNQECVLYVSRS